MKLTSLITGLLLSTLLLGQNTPEQESQAPLPSAHQVAQHLRNQYSIEQAAYLTQMAWQLSHSFASADQLQQQWQHALDTPVNAFKQYSHINTHALMAQTLIMFSNGMTLNRWRTVDLIKAPTLPDLEFGLTGSQAFQVWLNLPYFWQNILTNPARSNFDWLTFTDELPETVKTDNEVQPAYSLVLDELSSTAFKLNQSISKIDTQINHHDELSMALLRQNLHRNSNQLLAFANDWIEIYQLIELSQVLFTASEQQKLNDIIINSLEFWNQQLTVINQIDTELFTTIQLLMTELPLKFKNPDHLNTSLNKQFLSLVFATDDIDSYMTHPIRTEIQENLEVCLNLSVSQAPDPRLPIAINQFESCVQDFVNWAQDTAGNSTFTGNPLRLDNVASLHRALELPSFQVINILAMQISNDETCQQQIAPQVNVLEWLLASESLAWFHDRWPGIFAEVGTAETFSQLLANGRKIQQYPNCFDQNQLLQTQYQYLKSKWERLKQEINNHITQYTQEQLHQNTDVNLFGSMDQKTRYIPEGMLVKPCDVSTSCGAFIELKPTFELMNLFPNHVKLASQFGLGSLNICYDQVQWQNRKTSSTHLDNNKISNFEGQLSLQLNGMIDDKKVFSKTLLSQQRHVYLFGENNQETLDTPCPLSLVGKQINTSLDRGTFGLLPNRLTFLTAQKVDINKVIASNWDTWLATLQDDDNEMGYFDAMNGLKAGLNDAFLKHINQLQQQIYRKLIASNPSRANDSALSKSTLEYLNQRKLFNYYITGLFPATYHQDPAIRSALTGLRKLIDEDFFKTSYDNQVNIIDLMNLGDEIFSQHDSALLNDQKPASGFINRTLDELSAITAQ